MAIPVVCPRCGQSGKVADSLAGRHIKCPKCQTQFAVPTGTMTPSAAPRPAAQEPRQATEPKSSTLVGALAACGGALVVLLGLVVYLVVARTRPSAVPTAQAPTARSVAATAPLASAQPGPVAGKEARNNSEPEPADSSGPEHQSTDGSGRPQLSTEEIAAKTEAGIALIRGKISSGTGFLVAPGLVATNAHVLEDEFIRNIKIRFPSADEAEEGPLDARLLYEDPKRDLAFLQIKSPIAPLEIAKSYNFRRGQDITIIGNPGLSGEVTLENAISKGVMSTRTNIDGLDFYQLSIAINPGNSGGPVIDSTGQVIGVATLKAAHQEGLAFCVPVEDLQQAMQRVAKLKKAQIEQTAAEHRLTLVLRLLNAAGGMYLAGLDVYTEVATHVARTGGNVAPMVQQAARVFNEKIKSLDENLFGDLKTEVFEAASDPGTAPQTKQPLLDLWSTASEMKQMVNTPPLDYSVLSGQVVALRRRYRQAIAVLKTSLGPELADLLKDVPADLKRPLPFARSDPEPQPGGSSPMELTVVDLSFRPETRAGYVKVSGKLKNTSQRPITRAYATILVRDERGASRSRLRVPLVPTTIPPGGAATFFTRARFYSMRDRYQVEFTTSSGQKIPTVSGD